MKNRDMPPEDLLPPVREIVDECISLWNTDKEAFHIAVVQLMSKAALCSSADYVTLLDILSAPGIGTRNAAYLRNVATIGRCSVNGANEEKEKAIAWLRVHFPDDELLDYEICSNH